MAYHPNDDVGKTPPTPWGALNYPSDAYHTRASWGHGRTGGYDSLEMTDLDHPQPSPDPTSDKRALLDSGPPTAGLYYSRPGSPPIMASTSSTKSGRKCGNPFAQGWRDDWVMYSCFVFGVACAIGHHSFYNSLNGKEATDQILMHRYGTLLAFGARAGLSAAVGAAYHQRVWATVRKRIITLGSLDSLFSLTEDVLAFFSWELMKAAKLAMLLAFFVWISGLVVILTANTLQVHLDRVEVNDLCPTVRSLNFTMEELYDWRSPTRVGRYPLIPAVFWNTTKRPNDKDDDDWFDYYTAPAPTLDQTLNIAAFMGGTVIRKDAQAETCGLGWNCTYEIKFTAPAYKCTQLASGVGAKPVNLTQESGSVAPPLSPDMLLPKGIFSYVAISEAGEYSVTQMKDVDPGGIPKSRRPDPKNLGAFRTEPVIWVGHAARADPTQPLPENVTRADWGRLYVPRIFACENYESEYTVKFNLNDGGAQSTNVTSLKFLRPVVNTTYFPNIESRDGTADNITARPISNYIFPRDVRRYRLTAAYHALGLIARSFINGTVSLNPNEPDIMPLVNTKVIQTNLLDEENNYLPHDNLMERLQNLFADMILSILSNPRFASVVWAARSHEQSGLGLGGEGLGYPCQRSRIANVYLYRKLDLWVVYGLAIVVALTAVVVGLLAIRENGGASKDTHFSSIVAATRGPALDKLAWDDGTPAAGLPLESKKARLGYGRMGGMSSTATMATGADLGRLGFPRFGFTLEGDVGQARGRISRAL